MDQIVNNMKILVFVDNFMYPTLTFIYNEIKGLREKGHSVKLICTHRLNAEKFPWDDIEEIPLNLPSWKQRFREIAENRDLFINKKSAYFARRLKMVLNSFRPDAIIGHFGNESLILLENLPPTVIPVFIEFHGYDASTKLKLKSYVRKLNHYFHRFNIIPLVGANYMYKDLEAGGVNMKKARINHYGVDTSFFDPAVISRMKSHDKFRFLQVSSFVEKKGHQYTLEAFKAFLDARNDRERFEMNFVGEWVLFEKMKAYSKTLGLEHNVVFHGNATPAQCRQLYMDCDVFVHHSVTVSNNDKEGVPNSIIEAMAMEMPVLSTWHAGIPELVEDGVHGYLVKERDIEEYTKRMHDILTWKRVPACRKKVLDEFSLKQRIEKLDSYITEMVGRNC